MIGINIIWMENRRVLVKSSWMGWPFCITKVPISKVCFKKYSDHVKLVIQRYMNTGCTGSVEFSMYDAVEATSKADHAAEGRHENSQRVQREEVHLLSGNTRFKIPSSRHLQFQRGRVCIWVWAPPLVKYRRGFRRAKSHKYCQRHVSSATAQRTPR